MKNIFISDSFTTRKLSYERFAILQNQIINSAESDIHIDVDIQNRLGYTFVFMFSTLPYLAQDYNKRLTISCNVKSFDLFKKLNFISKDIQYQGGVDYSSIMKEMSRVIKEKRDVFDLVTEITGEAPVEMSEDLSVLFISIAGEMYNNATEHSHGTVIGSKYFKNQKGVYCFSCYDTGVGIPGKVMSAKPEITKAIEAFRWAMARGHSTASGNIPRGLGLELLRNFAQLNDGTIRICSGNIFYTYKSSKETYYELRQPFCGTLFEMDIVADNNRKYILT